MAALSGAYACAQNKSWSMSLPGSNTYGSCQCMGMHLWAHVPGQQCLRQGIVPC